MPNKTVATEQTTKNIRRKDIRVYLPYGFLHAEFRHLVSVRVPNLVVGFSMKYKLLEFKVFKNVVVKSSKLIGTKTV